MGLVELKAGGLPHHVHGQETGFYVRPPLPLTLAFEKAEEITVGAGEYSREVTQTRSKVIRRNRGDVGGTFNVEKEHEDPGSFRFSCPLVALWWMAVTTSRSLIFPAPGQVVLGMVELIQQGVLLKHVSASLFRSPLGICWPRPVPFHLGFSLAGAAAPARLSNPLLQLLRPISPHRVDPPGYPVVRSRRHLPIFLIFSRPSSPQWCRQQLGVHTIERQYIRAAQNLWSR